MIKNIASKIKITHILVFVTFFITFVIILSIFPFTKGENSKDNAGYCSMANGCPSDKCMQVSSCDAGGAGFGCKLGKYTCEYKDKNLKEKYTEITIDEAYECLQNYVSENASKHERLANIMPGSFKFGEAANYCKGYFDFEKNPADSYCWYATGTTLKDPIDPANNRYRVTFLIGAQTCQVYSDKTNDLQF